MTYSARTAAIGSTRSTRCVAVQAAAMLARSRRAPVARTVSAAGRSAVWINCCRALLNNRETTVPRTTPASAARTPSCAIMRRTWAGVAPSAMRTPISCCAEQRHRSRIRTVRQRKNEHNYCKAFSRGRIKLWPQQSFINALRHRRYVVDRNLRVGHSHFGAARTRRRVDLPRRHWLGIPDIVRDHLFECFATWGKSDGLGLGLALAPQILSNRGREIWLEPAARTRFSIRLPINRSERQQG